MLKTITTILIFVILAVFIALAVSFFFTPEKKARYEQCVLLQDPQTLKVDCFGCSQGKCKDAPTSWVLFDKPQTGIPYACFESEAGCQLAQ